MSKDTFSDNTSSTLSSSSGVTSFSVTDLDQLFEILTPLVLNEVTTVPKTTTKTHPSYEQRRGENGEELLSLREHRERILLFQLLCSWGVAPCLEEGVGLPESKRSSIINVPSSLSDKTKRGSQLQNEKQLWKCLKLFLYPLLNSTTSNEWQAIIVLNFFLIDLLAGLFQLLYRPSEDSTSIPSDPAALQAFFLSSSSSPSSSSLSNLPTDDLLLSEKEKMEVKQASDSLFSSLHVLQLLEALTTLLSIPKKPNWLLEPLTHSLSDCLLRDCGVSSLFSLLLGQNCLETEPPAGSFEKASRLLASWPKGITPEHYLQRIAPQLLTEFRCLEPQRSHWVKASSMTLLIFLERDWKNSYARRQKMEATSGRGEGGDSPPSLFSSTMVEGLIWKHIVAPFLPFLRKREGIPNFEDEMMVNERTLVSEEELQQGIRDFRHFLTLTKPTAVFYFHTAPVMNAFFKLHCYTIESNRELVRRECCAILSRFLRGFSNSTIFLKSQLLEVDEEDINILQTNVASRKKWRKVSFAAGPTGGVIVKEMDGQEEQGLFTSSSVRLEKDSQVVSSALVQILKETEDETLCGNLFLELLFEFQEWLERRFTSTEVEINLLTSKKEFRLLESLVRIMETFGWKIMKNLVRTCSLLKMILESSAQDPNLIGIGLTMLSVLLDGQIKFSKEEEILLFDLCPALERLSLGLEGTPEDNTPSRASELHQRIVNRDSKWCSKEERETSAASGGVEELKRTLLSLRDPLLTVRTQGLVELRRLVSSKDSLVSKNINKTLELFSEQLKDTETIVYLAAINGLSALGDIHSELVIPVIVKNYLDSSLDEIQRMKLGEVLVRVAQRCGELLPRYAHHFVNAFLRSAGDSLPSIRASSLSNLAGICETLKFGLHPYISDILRVIDAILTTEKEKEVRSGSVFVLTLLLRGMSKQILEFIPDELSFIYNRLRIVAQNDPDPVTSRHALIALGELETIMRSFLLLPPS